MIICTVKSFRTYWLQNPFIEFITFNLGQKKEEEEKEKWWREKKEEVGILYCHWEMLNHWANIYCIIRHECIQRCIIKSCVCMWICMNWMPPSYTVYTLYRIWILFLPHSVFFALSFFRFDFVLYFFCVHMYLLLLSLSSLLYDFLIHFRHVTYLLYWNAIKLAWMLKLTEAIWK